MKSRNSLTVLAQPKPLDFNDTSQLQQFINVDFDQINKEREKHLQQALSSTLKERRSELQQCELTLKRQQDKVNFKQNEIKEMQEKLSSMQKEIAFQKNETLNEMTKLEQSKLPFVDTETVNSIVSKLAQKRKDQDILLEQSKSLQLCLEDLEQQKSEITVKQTEIFSQIVSPFEAQLIKANRQLALVDTSSDQLAAIESRNLDQLQMLYEDCFATNVQRAELVQRREDLDALYQYLNQQAICKSEQSASEDLNRAFLCDLVIELQQYLMDKLTGQSNESMYLSNELDVIFEAIAQVPLNQSIISISNFSDKIGLIITKEDLYQQLESIQNQIPQQLESLGQREKIVQDVIELDAQIQHQRLRVKHELEPLIEAHKTSSLNLAFETSKQEFARQEIKQRLQVASQGKEHALNLYQVQLNNVASGQEISLQRQIDEIVIEIEELSMKISLGQVEIQKLMTDLNRNEQFVEAQKQQRNDFMADRQQRIRLLQLKFDQYQDMQQHPEHNPNSVAIFAALHELQSELDSEQNRLNYAKKKLQYAEQAYKHAQGVNQPKMYDLRHVQQQLLHSHSNSTVETMNTLDEEEMNHQLQQTKPLKARRHSLIDEVPVKKTIPPPLKLSELSSVQSKHVRQKSQHAASRTHQLKNFTTMAMSQASSSLTLREDELNESRSSTTTWRTHTQKKTKNVVHTMKRIHLSNKSGQGSISIPNQSKEAQFFQTVDPLISGHLFQVEMQSRQFCQKKVFLGLNLLELHVGSEVLLLDKLLKTELSGYTLELIKCYKAGQQMEDANFSFSLVVAESGSAQKQSSYRVKFITNEYETLKAWIVGLNCLISNKNNLTKLAQLIS